MTVEIGILNKQGIALAADSAVTIGNRQKFYNTANKLFALSKYNPVGIMVYSNSDFMGCPAEILIKEYRKKLGDKSFGTLKEYWDDFLIFLNAQYKENNNVDYYLEQVISFLRSLDGYIRDMLKNISKSIANSSDIERQKEVTKILYGIIDDTYAKYIKYDDDVKFTSKYKNINTTAREKIGEYIKKIIGILPDVYYQKLIECCIMILTKKHDQGSRTGIVIAGYGENELYPQLFNGEFLGSFYGELKYCLRHVEIINNDNDAAIVSFAQDDVIKTFMNGIDKSMLGVIGDTLDELKEKLISDPVCTCNAGECIDSFKEIIFEEINNNSLECHWGPIVQTVSVAPKEELAQMAETLVNLTSFRRKLSMDSYSQTVGGPIDVALITKGDGFIWIKRKHYFEKELNHGFFHNYYR